MNEAINACQHGSMHRACMEGNRHADLHNQSPDFPLSAFHTKIIPFTAAPLEQHSVLTDMLLQKHSSSLITSTPALSKSRLCFRAPHSPKSTVLIRLILSLLTHEQPGSPQLIMRVYRLFARQRAGSSRLLQSSLSASQLAALSGSDS